MCLSKNGFVLQRVGDVPQRPEFLTKIAEACGQLEPTLGPPLITLETTARTVVQGVV